MIATDRFVFIHVPKTGGTFVATMLKEAARRNPGFRVEDLEGRQHLGMGFIPREHRGKPILVNVRHPFEHYVSRFEFRYWAYPQHAARMFDVDRVREKYPAFPEVSFRDFVCLFNDWGLRRNPRPIDLALRRPVGVNSSALVHLVLPAPAAFLKSFDHMRPGRLRKRFSHVHFLRTEHLNDDLFEFLGDVEPDLDVEFIREAGFVLPPAGGRAKSGTWRDYFDEDLIRFVRRRDRLYFRLFPRLRADVPPRRWPDSWAGLSGKATRK